MFVTAGKALLVLVTTCNIVNKDYFGPCFTWTHEQNFELIDRAICNMEMVMKYEHATVYHLLRFCFDHRPILISLGESVERGSLNLRLLGSKQLGFPC